MLVLRVFLDENVLKGEQPLSALMKASQNFVQYQLLERQGTVRGQMVELMIDTAKG